MRSTVSSFIFIYMHTWLMPFLEENPWHSGILTVHNHPCTYVRVCPYFQNSLSPLCLDVFCGWPLDKRVINSGAILKISLITITHMTSINLQNFDFVKFNIFCEISQISIVMTMKMRLRMKNTVDYIDMT